GPRRDLVQAATAMGEFVVGSTGKSQGRHDVTDGFQSNALRSLRMVGPFDCDAGTSGKIIGVGVIHGGANSAIVEYGSSRPCRADSWARCEVANKTRS